MPNFTKALGNRFGIVSSSALFLASFASARILVYLVPLVIAAKASGVVYGAIEVALSVSLLVASFTISIPLAGANQQYLVAGRQGMGHLFTVLAIAGGTISLTICLIFFIADASRPVQLAVCAIGAAIFHTLFVTWFRMHGMRNAIAWSDGTATFIVGLILITLTASGLLLTVSNVALGYVAIIALLLIGALFIWFRVEKTDLKNLFLDCCRVGLPMVAVGSLAVWLGIGGRITIGLVSFKDVAAYSLAFRIAGLALGVHQLAVTALFARLYKSRTRWVDPMFSWFLIAASVLLTGLMLLGPLLINWFEMSSLDGGGEKVFRLILPANCIQTLFWIGYAMLQLRINRFNLSGRAILPTVVVLVLGLLLILGYGWFVSSDAVIISWMIAAHGAAFFTVNWVLLARNRLPHIRVGLTMIGGTLLLLIAGLISATIPA